MRFAKEVNRHVAGTKRREGKGINSLKVEESCEPWPYFHATQTEFMRFDHHNDW